MSAEGAGPPNEAEGFINDGQHAGTVEASLNMTR